MSAKCFLSGIALATFAASGLFFLKFWYAARDRFYLFFAIACWLLSAERAVLHIVEAAQVPIRLPHSESSSWVYLLRLAAFVVIFVAVFHKNRLAKNRGVLGSKNG